MKEVTLAFTKKMIVCHGESKQIKKFGSFSLSVFYFKKHKKWPQNPPLFQKYYLLVGKFGGKKPVVTVEHETEYGGDSKLSAHLEYLENQKSEAMIKTD